MRDENRIDEMCELLRRVWHLVPDWRLGQLVINLAAGASNGKGLSAFFTEDDLVEEEMKKWLHID